MALFEGFLFLIAIALVTACAADVRRERRGKRRGLLESQSVSGPYRPNRRR